MGPKMSEMANFPPAMTMDEHSKKMDGVVGPRHDRGWGFLAHRTQSTVSLDDNERMASMPLPMPLPMPKPTPTPMHPYTAVRAGASQWTALRRLSQTSSPSSHQV
ncbi:MAG: hypothetical protein Q9214_005270 [Letrouitia sp. 1 TL-2023]